MRQLRDIILTCFILLSVGIHAQVSDKVKQDVNLYEKNIKESKQVGDYSSAASYANKAAFLLWNNGAYDDAVGYFNEALSLNTLMDNRNGVMIIENNLGLIYSDMEQYAEAVKHYKVGLKMSRKLKLKETIASTLTNLAVAYQQNEQYNLSIQELNEAVTMAGELNDMKLLRRCYGILYENYEKTGESEKAYEYFNLYSSFDKEIKKVEMEQVKTKAETDVSMAHQETEATKKELNITSDILKQTEDSLEKAEILTREQKLELELKELEIDKEKARTQARNRLITGIAGALFITLLFLIIVFRQKNAIGRQKEQIERQNKNIKASIRYAQTIQNAILPNEEISTTLFEAFVIYMPKDIVSGDFYWQASMAQDEAHEFISVIDCTGHGVPGAFMSMIGNQLLNEIVIEKEVRSPKEVLTLLDNGVRTALKQEETDNNDGMDMSLCAFKKQVSNEIELTYAGAKRPMYHINASTNELNRLKGSRKSIGGKGRNVSIVTFHEDVVNLKKDDVVYMFSDGIVDQNDRTRKRFGSQQLEEVFMQLYKDDMISQKQKLQEIIRNFIQDEEQRDDITIMGIKIK